ncbi:hypothetical protein IEQ34_002514 [Dendrobium chrysotoxum]|uniref:Uncharacterized protein n=1 Tax=Dendrobium chrysotoxum TaxID=161865 RepID=A0AAV7HLL0_DENCH|nr:hypothetical protein IEQ34_002514 [Dendrobium chrysotoxum]
MQTNPIDPSQTSSSNTGLNPSFSRQVGTNALSTVLPQAVATGATAMLSSTMLVPSGSPLHRRARSEFALRIPEDFGLSSGDPMATGSFEEIGSEEDLFSTFMDIEKIGCKLEGSGSGSEDGVGQDRVAESSGGDQEPRMGNACDGGSAATSRAKHRHSNSLDGSSVSSMAARKGEVVFGEILEAKKAMTAEQLAELAAIDPKRAKRFVQFAHRSVLLLSSKIFAFCIATAKSLPKRGHRGVVSNFCKESKISIAVNCPLSYQSTEGSAQEGKALITTNILRATNPMKNFDRHKITRL